MISLEDHAHAAVIINEAIESGYGVAKACQEAGIDQRTFRRWTADATNEVVADARPTAERPIPHDKLSAQERACVLEACHEERFTDAAPPSQIVPTLAGNPPI